MKKFSILTSILALAACGGGSGGGGSAPIMPDAPVVPDETEIIRKSNSVITGMVSIDNEALRTSYVQDTLGDDYYSDVSGGTINPTRSATTPGNGNNICKSEKDCNDLAFNNMKDWLIENIDSLDEDAVKNSADLRKALILAGFKDKLSGNWDDVKAWFFANREAIKNQAQDIYDQLGKHEKFNLEDVVFTMSSASLGDENGAKDQLTFDVEDNGRIDGVYLKTYKSDNGTLVKADEGDVLVKRNGEYNEFPIHQERDGEIIDGVMAIETYGHKVGLRYSDFGAFIGNTTTIQENGEKKTGMSYEGFAGGYTNKEVDIAKVSEQMQFSGYAIGTVKPKSGNGDNLGLSGETTLIFDGSSETPTETLHMYFSENPDINKKWYDVKVVKTGNQADITFTNGDVIADDEYKFAGGNEFSKSEFISGNYYGQIDDDDNGQYGKIDIKYYGNTDKNKPVEATGVMQYVENAGEGDIRANIAFGVVKQ